jgi:hypothetical protein
MEEDLSGEQTLKHVTKPRIRKEKPGGFDNTNCKAVTHWKQFTGFVRSEAACSV